MTEDTDAPVAGPGFTGEEPAVSTPAPAPVSGDDQLVESPEPILDAPDPALAAAPVVATVEEPPGGFQEPTGAVTDEDDLGPDEGVIQRHPDEIPEGPVGVPFGMDQDGTVENGGTD